MKVGSDPDFVSKNAIPDINRMPNVCFDIRETIKSITTIKMKFNFICGK
jgi:hypothetical protein